MYWFVFYKMQKNAKLLLPSTVLLDNAYKFFNVFFLIILATKTAAIILKVIIQSRVDVFIMDWEAEKKGLKADGSRGENSQIAWRSIFVANEVNELSVEMRKINPVTTLMWFAFLWIAMGWSFVTQTNPDFTRYFISDQP